MSCACGANPSYFPPIVQLLMWTAVAVAFFAMYWLMNREVKLTETERALQIWRDQKRVRWIGLAWAAGTAEVGAAAEHSFLLTCLHLRTYERELTRSHSP